MKKKKKTFIFGILLLILALGLGYAFLTTTLNIQGTADVDSNTWNIYWDNVQVTEGSVAASTPVIDSSKTTVSYSVHFTEPGQFYEFTVDAKNDGTVDAMIDVISSQLNGNPITTLPDYLKYSITYDDDYELETKQMLNAGTYETYKIKIIYRDDIDPSLLPSTPQALSLTFGITYVQKDSTAISIPRPNNFGTDSWETIIHAAQSGNTSAYHVGDTKEIDMGDLGVHTLRIANLSYPDECMDPEFSQTACGFVLEFADVVTLSIMNDSTFQNYDWYNTQLYTYLVGDFYNHIPSELRDSIIDTYTVSTTSFNSTGAYTERDNKIYFLSTVEVMGTPRADFLGTDRTRQLDYYASIPVTPTSYNGAIKQYNGTDKSWWLRSAYAYGSRQGKSVLQTGFIYNDDGTTITITCGVSPAFRIERREFN